MKKNCAHCGREFEAQRSNAKYCKQSCRTSASYKKNGYVYRQGHYEKPGEKKEQSLPVPSALPAPQVMNGMEMGRATNEITGGGIAEAFIASTVSTMVTHQFTKGEYKAELTRIEANQKYSIYLLQNLYKALNIPFPSASNTAIKLIKPGNKYEGMKM